MSNNKQLVATQGLTMEDHVCIISLLECAKRGETRGKQSRPSICEVPRILREHNESSFIPQLVSIGPIHREDPKLKEFQWLKEHYLDDLLNRCDSRPKETLEACVLEVKTLLPDIKESYAMIKKCSDAELVRIMVIDGCFILEFCFKHADNKNLYLQMQNIRIAMDLMLLENQVPFFVLQALFDCCMGKRSFSLIDVLDIYLAPYIQLFRPDLFPEKNSILSIVLDKFLALYIKLFRSPLPEEDPTTDVDSSTHDHVLGYLHKRYQPVDEEQAAESSNPIHTEASKPVDEEQAAESSDLTHTEASNLVYHSIVDLDRSGINFKPHQGDNWSMTIKFQPPLFRCLPWFWSKPALLMPALVIQDFTELILRNFIAYEQSFCQNRYYFTSYAHAMDMLIHTEEDIAKLADSKVLTNQLGSNTEAAGMINKIGRNISVIDFNYTKVFKQMDEYHNRVWPRYVAWLRKVYFNNPWNFLALLGALILFGLTVTQTIYTIRAA